MYIFGYILDIFLRKFFEILVLTAQENPLLECLPNSSG